MRTFRNIIAILLVQMSVSTSAAEAMKNVIILAQNSGTEITDLLVPFAVLSDAGMNVEILSADIGPVNLMNHIELIGLRQMHQHSGRDIDLVVVPAVHHADDPAMITWLLQAHQQGAMIASICDGVELLAHTGLLDGRKATGHFFSASRRQKKFPATQWVTNKRYVHDRDIFTTAGVSASLPASVYLVEALLGTERAAAVANYYNIDRANADAHDGSAYSIGLHEAYVAARNALLGLHKKKYRIPVSSDVDELLLALTIDALGRTYRTSISLALSSPDIRTQRGLLFRSRPAHPKPDWQVLLGVERTDDDATPTIKISSPAMLLPTVFTHIANEYGKDSADFVATQLELPRSAGSTMNGM